MAYSWIPEAEVTIVPGENLVDLEARTRETVRARMTSFSWTGGM